MGLPLHGHQSCSLWFGFNYSNHFAIEVKDIICATSPLLHYDFPNRDTHMVHKVYCLTILNFPPSGDKLRIDEDSGLLLGA
jgi:hypothetical protein